MLRRELPEARKGKGEALNAAYRAIAEQTAAEGVDPSKVVVGIIDGDGQGSRNILLEVSRMLRDPRIGAVQVQVRIRNRNKLLGAVQDLEFGAIANACQSLRDTLDTVGLGGNGQFTRLSALQTLGDAPWSACLVEDLELGLRMHLDGVGIRYTSRATSPSRPSSTSAGSPASAPAGRRATCSAPATCAGWSPRSRSRSPPCSRCCTTCSHRG